MGKIIEVIQKHKASTAILAYANGNPTALQNVIEDLTRLKSSESLSRQEKEIIDNLIAEYRSIASRSLGISPKNNIANLQNVQP